MKKIITIITLVLICFNSFAQVPDKFSYQTVIRDSNKELVSNKMIAIQISILQGAENGPAIYTEIHKTNTNTNGLASFNIGNGELIQGAFSTIEWENGPFYLKSATDISGGGNYSIIGVSELLSVPYALNARSAENTFSGDYLDLENKPINVSEFFNDAGYITQIERDPGNGVPAQVWSLFGNSNSDPIVDKLGTTDYTDLVVVTDNLDRLRIYANGDINIDKSLEIGENLTVAKYVYLNTEAGETINNGNLTVANASSTSLTGTLEVDGTTDLNSSLDVNNTSPTTLTGTLDVDGATNLNSTLDVNNAAATILTGTLNVDGLGQFGSNINIDASTVTDYLVVTEEGFPNPTPRYGSIADIRGYFVADSISITGGLDIGGSLRVHGDSVVVDKHLRVGETTTLQNTLDVAGATHLVGTLDVDQTLNVDGASTLQSTLTVNGESYLNNQLTINAALAGDQSQSDAYPLFVHGSDQGIMVKLNPNTPNSSNNFMSFVSGNNVARGRIEGQTLTEWHNHFDFVFETVFFALDEALIIASAIAAAVTDPFPDPAEVVVWGAEGLSVYGHYAAWAIHMDGEIGVAFESGGADYAEWLQKENPEETFSPGDIVAVNGGSISKRYSNAAQSKFMVVSSNPIVIGNMPAEGRVDNYVRIAFMGQVPVKVRGNVNIGDYILASEIQDGFGIAKSPDSMELNDYNRIVGVAWSVANNNTGFNQVNVAVGINSNDVVNKIKQQQEEINTVKQEVNSIIAYLQSKDSSIEFSGFEESLFSDYETVISNGDDSIVSESINPSRANFIEEVMIANPDVIENILRDARNTLDKKGINYAQFEQTRRMLTEPQYLLQVYRESNK
jgi:hypothetical protein